MKRFFIVIIILFLFAFQVQAQIFNDNLNNGPAWNIDATRVVGILRGLACWFIRFGIIAVAIMITVYGILFLRSRGSPQGLAYAKKALNWGLVGAVVILGVFTIVLSLSAVVGVSYPIITMLNC